MLTNLFLNCKPIPKKLELLCQHAHHDMSTASATIPPAATLHSTHTPHHAPCTPPHTPCPHPGPHAHPLPTHIRFMNIIAFLDAHIHSCLIHTLAFIPHTYALMPACACPHTLSAPPMLCPHPHDSH